MEDTLNYTLYKRSYILLKDIIKEVICYIETAKGTGLGNIILRKPSNWVTSFKVYPLLSKFLVLRK